MPMVEHTGETVDDESSISQKLLDYGWVVPAAVGAAYVAKKGYDLYQGLKSRSINQAPQPSASQMGEAIDVPAREVAPKAEKPNPLNAYAEQKYGVPLATLEEKTGGPLKSKSDIDVVGGTISKGGNVSINTPGAFTQPSGYAPAPVAPVEIKPSPWLDFVNKAPAPTTSPADELSTWLKAAPTNQAPVVPQAPASQFDLNQLGQSQDPLANRGFQQPPQSIGPVAPTPSVQEGVATGNTSKSVQAVIAKEIDKTAGMYRDAQGNMVYPKGMSPAAIAGYEAFNKQYPDISKKLETQGKIGILGGGSGDNSLFNSYDADLAKKIRNEINEGRMIGAHGGQEGFYNKSVIPAINAIPPDSPLGKELNNLKMAQEVLGKKGGSYGELGTPASIGGKKGGLVTGANIVPETIKKGGSAILLLAMADAAKAATEGNMTPSKELGFDLATGAGMAKMLGGPAALAASMAFGSTGLNPNEEKELAYRRKVGAGRGIAPPSAYMR